MEYVNALENLTFSSLPENYQKNLSVMMLEGNPNSRKFMLMNPFHTILISVGYLITIYLGMKIMKDRKKFDLFWFSLLHNGILVMLSAYMCYESIHQALAGNYSLFGNGVDPSVNGLPMARVMWIFYMSKPIEFIDTFIMVLKKNFHQVSFLHVYHHFSIFLIWWAIVFFVPGGDSYFSAAQNSFIHVLMYSYYFLATLKISAPWKYYITQLQMLQFTFNAIQGIYVTYYDTPYPKKYAMLLIVYMISLLILFGNFYIQGTRRAAAARAEQKLKKAH